MSDGGIINSMFRAHQIDDSFTELHIAVNENRVSEVQNLVGNKTLINTQTKYGATSLLLSCRVDTTIPEILIKSGADVNLTDYFGCSPLMEACNTGKVEIVKLLLTAGANINLQDDYKYHYTALHYAIENDNLQLVDLLLQSGADISLLDSDGYSPLMLATSKSNVSKDIIIKLVEQTKLVKNKTLINTQTKNGETSLLLSCRVLMDTTIPEILIKSGADINLTDNDNCSPLLAACEKGKVEIVKLLLTADANINLLDESKYTALHYAIENDNLQLVDLLLQSGADTSLLDSYGYSPLMLATSNSNVSKDIIIKLVEQGADVNINVNGVTPTNLALKRRDPTIFEYLWDFTDIEVLKKGGTFQNFIEAMLTSDWITPSKIQYFYKVLDTPGVELNDRGYLGMIANSINSSLRHRSESQEEFLSIDICGIITKLLEKNAKLDDIWDTDVFIGLFLRNKIDFTHLFQILINNNVDFNFFPFISMTLSVDPEVTVLLLPFSIHNSPIDVLRSIVSTVSVYSLDIRMLKLTKSILRLCTPDFDLREDLIKHFKSCDAICDLKPEEKVIWSELVEFLSVNTVPTLKELSRDLIRYCLRRNCVSTTEDYLNKLNNLHLPKFVTDIIRCKSVVNTLE